MDLDLCLPYIIFSIFFGDRKMFSQVAYMLLLGAGLQATLTDVGGVQMSLVAAGFLHGKAMAPHKKNFEQKSSQFCAF